MSCRVKFLLTIFIFFFACFHQAQSGRPKCDSECLENKLEEVLRRIKYLTEDYTPTPTLESLFPEEYGKKKTENTPTTQNRRQNIHSASSNTLTDTNDGSNDNNISDSESEINSDSDTNSNSNDNNNPKCTKRLAEICNTTGMSEIQMADEKMSHLPVLCASDRYIVILQRFNGSLAFHNRTWDMYKQGFGNIAENSEFFLGLQHLHELTFDGSYKLRIDMEDHEGVHKHAHYSDFSIFNEESGYKLGMLGVYDGTAGDALMYHEGQQFSTMDRDNDVRAQGSCSGEYRSAGWFKNCMEANIFGNYYPDGKTEKTKQGMFWETFRGPEYSLKRMKMSIRAKCLMFV